MGRRTLNAEVTKLHKILLAALGSSCLVTCAPSGPPHVVLISVDTLRWDYLGAYGYEEPNVSPTINWLAQNGTVFEQAVAPAGTTVPSHGTMLTGLYPRHHGARSNHHGLYPETDTIARALGDAQYQTGAFFSTRFMGKAGRLNRHFQSDNMAVLLDKNSPNIQHGDETISQASAWLDSLDPERPAFLFLHLWEVHMPLEPSDWSRARNSGYNGFLNSRLTVDQLLAQADEIRNSPGHLSAMRTLYAGEVNRVDAILDRFFEDWRERGLLENSVVIFTADHGERLGEAGLFGHGPTHDEHVIRVPLIVADFRNPQHRRIETRVGTIDIAPTLADYAGLANRFDRFGYSIRDPDALDPDRPYFAEVELRTSKIDSDKLNQPWYDPNAVAVWVGGLKLESKQGRLALLETHTDNELPESVDPDSEPIMLNYMSGLIDTFRETELDLTESSLSEEELEELRGLGYVQ